MSDICDMCKGQQNFIFLNEDKKVRWKTCDMCNGLGTKRVHSFPTIQMHWRKSKRLAKANDAFDKEWNFPAKNNPKFLKERS